MTKRTKWLSRFFHPGASCPPPGLELPSTKRATPRVRTEGSEGPSFGQAPIGHSRACVSGFRCAPVEVFLAGSESWRHSEFHGGIPMRLCRAGMLLFSVILTCALSAPPQTAVTSLHGTVVDPGGAVTPQADITLLNRESGFKQARKSNSEGEY